MTSESKSSQHIYNEIQNFESFLNQRPHCSFCFLEMCITFGKLRQTREFHKKKTESIDQTLTNLLGEAILISRKQGTAQAAASSAAMFVWDYQRRDSSICFVL